MSIPKARVVAHKMIVHETRVAVIVSYLCPLCGEEHGAGWHSPTSEGGERNAPCAINPGTGVGELVALTWPGIPGLISAALIEYRPDILTRADAPQWDNQNPTPEKSEGGQ